MSHLSTANFSSPESLEKLHMAFWIWKLLNIAAFGAMSCNFVYITALFGNDEADNEKWVSGCTLLLISAGTICSFLGRLKLIFCSIAGSALFRDRFHAQSWLVTAVLFCWILTHASNLNRRAATWLHTNPRLKEKTVAHNHVLHYNKQCSYLTQFSWLLSVSYISCRNQSFGLKCK